MRPAASSAPRTRPRPFSFPASAAWRRLDWSRPPAHDGQHTPDAQEVSRWLRHAAIYRRLRASTPGFN